VTTALALSALAFFDCLLAGFRAAAGRDGRLDKRAYYVSAVARAGGWGLLLIGANALVAAALCFAAPDPTAAFGSLVSAGRLLVGLYGAFAAAVLAAFALYLAPVADLRVLANVLVFGPLTLARSWVIAGGLLYVALRVPDLRVAMMAASAGASTLAFEGFLRRRNPERSPGYAP
jgi:hypothetical protein